MPRDNGELAGAGPHPGRDQDPWLEAAAGREGERPGAPRKEGCAHGGGDPGPRLPSLPQNLLSAGVLQASARDWSVHALCFLLLRRLYLSKDEPVSSGSSVLLAQSCLP